jgi:hypothetical protein
MTREQAEQIAWKHVDLRNKMEGHEDALTLSVAVNAILDAVAIEREECAKEAEYWQTISTTPGHACGQYIAAAIRGRSA